MSCYEAHSLLQAAFPGSQFRAKDCTPVALASGSYNHDPREAPGRGGNWDVMCPPWKPSPPEGNPKLAVGNTVAITTRRGVTLDGTAVSASTAGTDPGEEAFPPDSGSGDHITASFGLIQRRRPQMHGLCVPLRGQVWGRRSWASSLTPASPVTPWWPCFHLRRRQ